MTSASSYGPQGFTFTFEDRTMGMLQKGYADFKAPYVINCDLAFLHYQQYELEKRYESGSELPYFIPARCDVCVATFRKWIRQYAHLQRPLPPPVSQTDRLSLFDHYGQHTSPLLCHTTS